MLTRQQYDFIKYLAQPDQGGLTMAEIAEEVGVSERTLYNWKNNETFQKELKRTILKYSLEGMPKVMEAIERGITEDRNAAMARLWTEMQGLTSKDRSTDESAPDDYDIESMRKRIEEYRKRHTNVVSIDQ